LIYYDRERELGFSFENNRHEEYNKKMWLEFFIVFKITESSRDFNFLPEGKRKFAPSTISWITLSLIESNGKKM
jgi:hypothetical protein